MSKENHLIVESAKNKVHAAAAAAKIKLVILGQKIADDRNEILLAER